MVMEAVRWDRVGQESGKGREGHGQAAVVLRYG